MISKLFPKDSNISHAEKLFYCKSQASFFQIEDDISAVKRET